MDRRVTVSGLPSPSSAAGLDHISGDADQDIDFTDTSPQIYDQSIVPFQTDSESTALLNSSTADLPPDVLAWPWLHENLFLQGDMNLDWYEISARTEQAEAVDIAGTYSSVPAVPQDGLDTEQLHHVNGGRLPSSHVSGDVGCDDTNRAKYVEEVVKIASQISQEGAFQGQPSQQRILFLRDVARLYGQLEKLFDLPATDGCQDIESRTVCSFQSFLLLYKNHFWPLWPFTPRYSFDHDEFDPLLYLAMVSIGSMYGGRQSSRFGSVLHECLRDELINPLLDINVPRQSLLPLGQARSLTQAAALYFGQKKAFSYAQHLSGVLIAQARKMEIFTTSLGETELWSRSQDAGLLVSNWINIESRKRLAFASLRLEMYTSVLHSTRPLVSGEEIELNLPCSHSLWSSSFTSEEAFAAAIRQECNTSSMDVLYTDLLSISLDNSEKLPHLSMLHLEILMNGLQEKIWSACNSKNVLERLSNEETTELRLSIDDGINNNRQIAEPLETLPSMEISVPSSLIQSLDAHLVWGSRRMNSIRADLRIVVSTLRKVRTAVLDITRMQYPRQGMSQADRSSLLSCLLMFHLAFLQLNCPLTLIHQVCHNQLATPRSKLDSVTKRVGEWIHSSEAFAALKHAVSIFQLLESETEKPLDTRASVNFLTMTGLYHSAALVWTYTQPDLNTIQAPHTDSIQGNVRPRETVLTTELPRMPEFEKVLHDINPAWASRSSFAVALAGLRKADTRL